MYFMLMGHYNVYIPIGFRQSFDCANFILVHNLNWDLMLNPDFGQILGDQLANPHIQATTAIVDTVIVESTAIVEQKPLTTQFYLLLVESPL